MKKLKQLKGIEAQRFTDVLKFIVRKQGEPISISLASASMKDKKKALNMVMEGM